VISKKATIHTEECPSPSPHKISTSPPMMMIRRGVSTLKGKKHLTLGDFIRKSRAAPSVDILDSPTKAHYNSHYAVTNEGLKFYIETYGCQV
jgi:hypothetical protein